MANHALDPRLEQRIIELERLVYDEKRAQSRLAPLLSDLANVEGLALVDGEALIYAKARGVWVARRAATVLAGRATSDLNPLTGSYQDVAGTSLTFDTLSTYSAIQVTVVFDFELTAGAGAALGRPLLDGATISAATAVLLEAANRGTVAQVYSTLIPAAGPHTLKLQASKTGGGGSGKAFNPHTGWTAVLID